MIRWPWAKPDNDREAERNDERRAAFDRLARAHARELYGAALRMARNADDAQDLAQEALVRAFVAFDTFTPGTNFRAWLLRILTNSYINRCRRRRRIAFLPWEELTEGNDGGPAADTRAAGRRLSDREEPETVLLLDVLDDEIETALARLSEGVRLTILLVDVEQLPYEEVAAILAIPIGTVRSRLNRGREQLRALLTEYARSRRLLDETAATNDQRTRSAQRPARERSEHDTLRTTGSGAIGRLGGGQPGDGARVRRGRGARGRLPAVRRRRRAAPRLPQPDGRLPRRHDARRASRRLLGARRGGASARRATNDQRPTTNDRRGPTYGLRATGFRLGVPLALGLLLAVVAVAAGFLLRSGPEFDVRPFLAPPMPAQMTLATPDADQAARWMSARLGAEIPPVNLSLLGGRLVGAKADPKIRQGELLFRDARGASLLLYVFLERGIRLPPIASVRYEGADYRVAEQASPRRSILVWQAQGRTFAVVSPLPASELLPYAREMDRHCRRRR
jgi:RNA polymerase sigma-70 factor (ECF subfamily)